MAVTVLWVAAAILSWAAGAAAANTAYRHPADLDHSPVQMPQKDSRLLLNPFGILGTPDCDYQGKTGTCYGEVECLALAGNFGGFCSGLTGLCCIFYRTCGMRTSQRSAYFRNQQYPQSGRATESCTFDIIKRSEEYCGLRVNMEEAHLPEPSRNGLCNEASYMVGGTRSSQITPKCGDLTGRSFVYDMRYQDEMQLTINSTTLRSGINWNIMVQQVPCSEYTGEDLTGNGGVDIGSVVDTGTDVDIGTGSNPGTGSGSGSGIGSGSDIVPGIATGPDGGTDSSAVGPTGPVLPPGAQPPAPPPTTSVTSKPAFARCGQRGPPFHPASRNRDAASRRMTLEGPFGPDMAQFSGRRKNGYPRPGNMFRRPGPNFRRRDTPPNRPSRTKNNENRRNRPSNRKQAENSKGNSAVQQETQPAVRDEATPAITTDEWGVPTRNDSLFHQYLGDRSVFSSRITFGQLAGLREFPWQVAMTVSGKFHCGACIIGEYWILTAAHCVVSYKNSPRTLELSIGDWDLSATNDGPNTQVEVATITVHPEYSRSTLQNDLAILKLTSKIVYTDDIQPICLPDKDVASAGRPAIVSGWGRDEHMKLQPQLHFLEAKIMSNVLCDARWNAQGAPPGFIVRSMMCMDATNGDSCNGDSGGPSVLEEPAGSGNYVLGGLVSFGSGSCVDAALPGVYTRVEYFRDWIVGNMV